MSSRFASAALIEPVIARTIMSPKRISEDRSIGSSKRRTRRGGADPVDESVGAVLGVIIVIF
jgi:hypothetical protein